MPLRDLRDPNQYPLARSVFGETVNIAAITTYVRILDLLDVGEDRTPYALWKFVLPADPISSLEWRRHRSLSPVAVKEYSALREVLITGHTDDSEVFAALADLQAYVDDEFAGAIAQLRSIGGKYILDLDSRITWNIETVGFDPLRVRFELDRREVLRLLSSELYRHDPHAFVRELLQNSVDAIDAREALLAKNCLTFQGEIHVRLTSEKSGLCIEWRDNGIGMDEDVLAFFFARLGQCWHLSREADKVAQIDAISRFGIGVLSFFAVSNSLTVETQRDPHVGRTQPRLLVDIPTLASHFRISTVKSGQVGTTLRLKIPSHFNSVISKDTVCAALRRIARYVRHRIAVECDGVPVQVTSLAKEGNAVGPSTSGDDLGLQIVGMQGDSATTLEDTTTKITFEIGQLGGNYHGHYAAIVPKCPEEVRSRDDYGRWSLGDKSVGLADVLIDSEEALFVKGIQSGSVSGKARGRESGFSGARFSAWIKPKFLLNVPHPSFLEFNLERSSARLKSNDWIEEVWREIASKLRTRAFNWPITSAADSARLLGACALFGAVPDSGLESLVGTTECPLLVLQPGRGLTWRALREVAQDDRIVEGPFELGYTSRSRDWIEIGSPSGLEGWEGDDALFPLDGLSSYRYPWLAAVVAFGYRALAQSGWYPAEIRLVQPPEKETVPLVCRVWRRSASAPRNEAWCEEETAKGHGTGGTGAVRQKLFSEAPEVLPFPQSIAQYAAFGSRYWNSNHSKISAILPVLTELMEWRRLLRLSPDGEREVSYLTSNRFYGYVVPARFSKSDLALDVPNRLLDVSEKEGLPCAVRLTPEDFVPETIKGYQNPYHYDLQKWKKPGTGLGQRLDSRAVAARCSKLDERKNRCRADESAEQEPERDK